MKKFWTRFSIVLIGCAICIGFVFLFARFISPNRVVGTYIGGSKNNQIQLLINFKINNYCEVTKTENNVTTKTTYKWKYLSWKYEYTDEYQNVAIYNDNNVIYDFKFDNKNVLSNREYQLERRK